MERETECDKCIHKKECIEKGHLIYSVFSGIRRAHYIKGRNCICIKGCEKFLEMKLSEILEVADTDKLKDIIEKAIEQFGDITYREFYQDGKFLEMDLER